MKDTKSDKTYTGYKADLMKFRASCKKQFVDQITEADLQKFVQDLRADGLSKRTIYKVFQGVNTFLRIHKVMLGSPILKKLGGEYDEKVARAYTEEELKALFTECDEDERIVFKFFLASGCREGEVAHTEWRDLDFVHNKLHIQPMPEWKWKVKDKEDRFRSYASCGDGGVEDSAERCPAHRLGLPERTGAARGSLPTQPTGDRETRWVGRQVGVAPIPQDVCHAAERLRFATSRDGWDTTRFEVTQAYLKGAEAESETAQSAANTAFAAFA